MAPDSRKNRIPVEWQIILGLCLICLLIITPLIVSWYLSGPASAPKDDSKAHLKILAINDFHGQLPPGQSLNKRPVGGALVLDSYLTAAMASVDTDGIIIALPGDVVGGSPPESGLLLDEPTMLYFNTYANPYCSFGSDASESSCNMVATVGNHEFDEGVPELMRLIHGGNGATTITHLVDPYPGTKSSYVCANVVYKENNTLLFPPYTVNNVSGVPVAFIGVVTTGTPRIQKSEYVKDLIFLDEAESINRYIPELQSRGVHAIVVLLHEGGSQEAYDGPTRENTTVTGRVAGIVSHLDGDVDVVLSGHTHMFTNAFLENAGGNPVLVTQAYMSSKGFADVDLVIDRPSGEIVKKSAAISPAYADLPSGTIPNPALAAFLALDTKIIAPQVDQRIGVAARDMTRDQNPAGESAMGNLVVDGERAAMNADVGLATTGSVRADLSAGTVTWGDLYSVQPFAGSVLTMTLSGEQIERALEQQWQEPLPPHNLAVSGLTYRYDATKPAGSKVSMVTIRGLPLDRKAIYTVAMVDFLAGGGDGYTTFLEGTNRTNGPKDVDALVSYVESLPQPVDLAIDGRVQRDA